MKMKELLFLLLLFSLNQIQAQDYKIIVNSKGKIGFSDSNGNEVIKCEYESVLPFKDGLSIVTKSKKMGMIDKTGNVVLPMKHSQITEWTEDLYLVKNGKQMGLVDKKGNFILPQKYTLISRPNSFGKALIAVGGKPTTNDKKTYMANAKYGIIDKEGKIIINPIYKGLYEFTLDCTSTYPYNEGKRLEYSYHNTIDTLVTDCKFLGFSKNGFNIYKSGILDESGKEIMKMGLYDFVMLPQNGMVRYYIKKSKETICGYYDIEAGKALEVKNFKTAMDNINYWTHGDFTGNIAPVNGESWTFVDRTGKVIRQDYNSLKHSTHLGLWGAKNATGKWDVFTENNEDATSLSGYMDILFPVQKDDKEMFVVMKDNLYGAINKNGEVIIPFEYESASANTYDCVAVQKNGMWGMLTASNDSLIPIKYAGVMLPSQKNAKNFWIMKSDSLCYHLNTMKNSLSEKGFKYVSNFSNGLAHVAPLNLAIEDNQINRSQLFTPNTKQSTISEADLQKSKNAFGYLLNENDEIIMDKPISTIYIDAVRTKISEKGGKNVSEQDKKNILLEVTRNNRSYNLDTTLSEEEWNY